MKLHTYYRILAGAMSAFVAGQVIASDRAARSATPQHQHGLVIAVASAADSGQDSALADQQAQADSESKAHGGLIIKAIEPESGAEGARENSAWLGISTEEAPEALSAQLGLDRGAGLVVTYVTPESPAARAGLQKNDLIVEFEGQSLVLPGQLRKLVQARKEGDQVNIVYFREGKKETAAVTLAKSRGRLELNTDDRHFELDLHGLREQLGDLPIRGAIREQMQALRESLGNLKIDQKKVQEELRRSLEEARRAFERAVKDASEGAKAGMGSAEKALKELEESEVVLKNPAVTVRSSGKTVKSIVKSDDSGTVVIVWNPRPHLTAHDKDGKLVFDGEIASDEQREKVPRDLWERVEPMLDKMQGKAE